MRRWGEWNREWTRMFANGGILRPEPRTQRPEARVQMSGGEDWGTD